MTSAGRILIMPKGEYDATTTYEMLDLVAHQGSSWLAKKTAIGIEPSYDNEEYWMNICNVDEAVKSLYEDGADYVKMPDGTMICYGMIRVPEDEKTLEVVFPETFINPNIFMSYANRYHATEDVIWSFDKMTASGFRVHVHGAKTGEAPTSVSEASYIAIGRWK